MDVEKKRLLQEDNEGETFIEAEVQGKRSSSHTFWKKNWVTVCSVLYGLIATILLIWVTFSRPAQLPTPYSPISHIVEPVIQKVYPKEHSVYSKEPSEELDEAWAELVAPMLISASEHEVKLTEEDPAERLELTSGGYLGSIGVFHELHCLRRLYWHMYEDIYFQNYTEAKRDYEKGHARHCIETLRRSLMCQANTALYTFEWDENNSHSKQVLTSKAQRECIKWDPVHEWASSRSVGLNPTFYRPGVKHG